MHRRTERAAMPNGDTLERELVNALTDLGYPAIRTPASGGGTDRDLPDVIAGSAAVSGDLSNAMALECKRTSKDRAYVAADEVEALDRFATGFGATPLLSVKFLARGGGRTPIFLVPISEPRRTDAGTYVVAKAEARRLADSLVYPATKQKAAAMTDAD